MEFMSRQSPENCKVVGGVSADSVTLLKRAKCKPHLMPGGIQNPSHHHSNGLFRTCFFFGPLLTPILSIWGLQWQR